MCTRCWSRGSEAAHGLDAGPELAVVDERLQVGVVEQVAELLLDVPVVHVHRHGADLVGGQRRLDPLDAVGAVDADVVAGLDALGDQVVGEPVGPLLELPVGAPLVADDQHLAVGHEVDGVLEQVRDVVRHSGSDDTSDSRAVASSGQRLARCDLAGCGFGDWCLCFYALRGVRGVDGLWPALCFFLPPPFFLRGWPMAA